MARSKKTTKKTAKKAVKKQVKKIVVETPPTYTLSEEQYDKLYRLVSWDNPLSKLDDISTMTDTTLLEIGYKVGIIYNEFEKMLEESKSILLEIDPSDTEDTSDEDDWISYDDEDNN